MGAAENRYYRGAGLEKGSRRGGRGFLNLNQLVESVNPGGRRTQDTGPFRSDDNPNTVLLFFLLFCNVGERVEEEGGKDRLMDGKGKAIMEIDSFTLVRTAKIKPNAPPPSPLCHCVSADPGHLRT